MCEAMSEGRTWCCTLCSTMRQTGSFHPRCFQSWSCSIVGQQLSNNVFGLWIWMQASILCFSCIVSLCAFPAVLHIMMIFYYYIKQSFFCEFFNVNLFSTLLRDVTVLQCFDSVSSGWSTTFFSNDIVSPDAIYI